MKTSDGFPAGPSRRGVLAGATGSAMVPLAAQAAQSTAARSQAAHAETNRADVRLRVNGQERPATIDGRASLLDTLRESLHLTGAKKGCDHGQCGACTVLIDGRRMLSCLTLAVAAQGREITTIEGLAEGQEL